MGAVGEEGRWMVMGIVITNGVIKGNLLWVPVGDGGGNGVLGAH